MLNTLWIIINRYLSNYKNIRWTWKKKEKTTINYINIYIMGQAWCKAKAAQDPKSPFDRILVRCAHRIYPGLKEECSVLGATQRVTSSEIGYARGCSVDSTDKPFHPSEWVDVNLEVSNTILYSNSNLTKNIITPIPPPRKRKKIRGRPLPPKPDDIIENHRPIKCLSTNSEPLYSSVKTQNFKTTYTHLEPTENNLKEKNSHSFEDLQKLKESYDHEVNSTKELIPNDVVVSEEERSFIDNRNVRRRSKLQEEEEEKQEYDERFLSSQSIQNFSTTNHFNKDHKDIVNNLDVYNERSKNNSTISLPNYNELQVTRESYNDNKNNSENEKQVSSERLLRKSIASSLPPETFIFNPKITNEKFEDIVWQADFQDVQINKFENDKFMNLNKIQSEDANNQERMEKSPSKINISPNYGSLNSLETSISEQIKASTPIKTVNDDISKKLENSRLLDSTESSHREKNKVEDDSRNSFFSPDTSNLYSQVFYEVKDTLADDSKFSQEEIRNSEILKQNEREEKELVLDSEIHRTISEESLPIEMLEAVDSDLDKADDDDFFERKTTKDVQNRLMKNFVSTEDKNSKEIINTPPSSPVTKIKADVVDNDHSALLKVLQEEASLLELEIALSDMLEKKNDEQDEEQTDSLEIITIKNDDVTKSEEKLIEPVDKEKIFIDKLKHKDENKLQNMENSNKSSKDRVKIVAVELKNNNTLEKKKEILHDLSKNNVNNILNNALDSKAYEMENSHGDEAPEKPSRMHRINVTNNSVENYDDNVPTPPRRRHRSGSSILKENVCRPTIKSKNEDPYINDRLI
ncbi:general transcriptional corepressor trfA-like isoform X2 [Leptopilina boulardi]|uniref:general transcriptional corepressor trfA-like isoform X2 n=1 Tax=Leptopilina boulardi TaxID=63433 RepID=UPI0021F57ED6|nr:general transcriptional corepressor trfA-like isoform X2 [Leptopilina boulardi]